VKKWRIHSEITGLVAVEITAIITSCSFVRFCTEADQTSTAAMLACLPEVANQYVIDILAAKSVFWQRKSKKRVVLKSELTK